MTERPNSLRVLNGMPALTRLNKKKTALLMIDFQMESFTGLLPASETEKLAEKAARLMDWADKNKIKTIHMQRAARSPASPVYAPGSPGAEFHPDLAPRKKHEAYPHYGISPFSGTLLHGLLQAAGIDTLILAGLTTPLSVAAAAFDAYSLGYSCLIAADATASRDLPSWDGSRTIPAGQLQEGALAALADRCAQVMTCADLAALPFDA